MARAGLAGAGSPLLLRSPTLLGLLASTICLGLITVCVISSALREQESALLSATVADSTQLYAPASSPLYLEPFRHQASEESAWKWAASMRQHRAAAAKGSKLSSPNAGDRVAGGTAAVKSDSARGVGKAKKSNADPPSAAKETAAVTQLAEESPAKPCPWYGCADGSDFDFSSTGAARKVAAPKAADAKKHVAPKAADAKKHVGPKAADPRKHVAPKAADSSKHQKLLSHGFGTVNTFTAQPSKAPHDQFYGGTGRFYGSSRPVTSHGGKVDGTQAYAADLAHVYDFSSPTSFDSIPLASPSTQETRVALHQPAGDGALNKNIYRCSAARYTDATIHSQRRISLHICWPPCLH